MNQADIDGMKEIFDFDPHEGPHLHESEYEFEQRIQIREELWTVLEIIIMAWLNNSLLSLNLNSNDIKLANKLQKWGLIIGVKPNNNYLWQMTPVGVAYYFSDKHCD